VLLAVTRAGPARLSVYDAAGRRVRVLFDGIMSSGRHGFDWDGTDAAGRPRGSGVYWLRAEQGAHAQSQKLVMLK
jgi:flagellar hook assembly protein FlgD